MKRRWKDVGFSSPPLWVKFKMQLYTEMPGRPGQFDIIIIVIIISGYYNIINLNDYRRDKAQFAMLLGVHLNI